MECLIEFYEYCPTIWGPHWILLRFYTKMSFKILNFFQTFFQTFSNFFSNFFQTFFRSFFELPPSHPLDSPPTICKLCPINNYNFFLTFFQTFFQTCFKLFFELFSNFLRTTSLSFLSPLQQFVIKAQFNYVIINFNKKNNWKNNWKYNWKYNIKYNLKYI
jgi:hypothetical protein